MTIRNPCVVPVVPMVEKYCLRVRAGLNTAIVIRKKIVGTAPFMHVDPQVIAPNFHNQDINVPTTLASVTQPTT